MSTIRTIRRALNLSQDDVALKSASRSWHIQALEYGLGHGQDLSELTDLFPSSGFISRLVPVLECSLGELNEAYQTARDHGDHQLFSVNEMPGIRFSELLKERSLTGDDLAEMTAIRLSVLQEVADGKSWASPAFIRDVARALHMDPLRLETITWSIHCRRTAHLLLIGDLPANRPRRRGGPRGIIAMDPSAVMTTDERTSAFTDAGIERNAALAAILSPPTPNEQDPARVEAGELGPRDDVESSTSPPELARCGDAATATTAQGPHPAGEPLPPWQPATKLVATVKLPPTLAEARESQGLTIRAMAKHSGLSTATISNLERGRFPKVMQQSTKDALAMILDIDPPLLGRTLAMTRDVADRRRRQRELMHLSPLETTGDDFPPREKSLADLRESAVPTEAERAARSQGFLTSGDATDRSASAGNAPWRSAAHARYHQRAVRGHMARAQRPRGISQEEAALRCALSVQAYRHIERGHVRVREATLRRVVARIRHRHPIHDVVMRGKFPPWSEPTAHVTNAFWAASRSLVQGIDAAHHQFAAIPDRSPVNVTMIADLILSYPEISLVLPSDCHPSRVTDGTIRDTFGGPTSSRYLISEGHCIMKHPHHLLARTLLSEASALTLAKVRHLCEADAPLAIDILEILMANGGSYEEALARSGRPQRSIQLEFSKDIHAGAAHIPGYRLVWAMKMSESAGRLRDCIGIITGAAADNYMPPADGVDTRRPLVKPQSVRKPLRELITVSGLTVPEVAIRAKIDLPTMLILVDGGGKLLPSRAFDIAAILRVDTGDVRKAYYYSRKMRVYQGAPVTPSPLREMSAGASEAPPPRVEPVLRAHEQAAASAGAPPASAQSPVKHSGEGVYPGFPAVMLVTLPDGRRGELRFQIL